MPTYSMLLFAIPGASVWLVASASVFLSVLLALLIDRPMDRLVRSKISTSEKAVDFLRSRERPQTQYEEAVTARAPL
jgi:hypothetical protein